MEKISYNYCHDLCTDRYGWFECFNDCQVAGYAGGECASPSSKIPKKCCCQK